MPSADGFIKSTAGDRFIATFMVKERTFNFSGSFASSVPEFACNTATLEYLDLNSVSSTRTFGGHIGPTRVFLNLENGPTMAGMLNQPLSSASTVSGSGSWTQS